MAPAGLVTPNADADAMSDKIMITADQAIALLPDRESIHSFRQAGPVLIGCDSDREDIIERIRATDHCEIGGPACKAMDHALVIRDDNAALFIETDMEKVAVLEMALKIQKDVDAARGV